MNISSDEKIAGKIGSVAHSLQNMVIMHCGLFPSLQTKYKIAVGD